MADPAPTSNPALHRTVSDLTVTMHEVLGANFVGAYLQGSLAIGDFDEYSDVDYVIAVTEEPEGTDLAAISREIVRLHGGAGRFDLTGQMQTRPESENHWRSSLEGSFFPVARLKDWTLAGGELWYVDNGSTRLERSSHDDTLVVRWTLRERGVTLLGPEPRLLIDPIPDEALRAEVLRTIERVAADIEAEVASKTPTFWETEFGQPYAVLSMCRMLETLATVEVRSKLSGMRWGLVNLPAEWRGLIERAWEQRKGAVIVRPADKSEFALTRSFVEFALKEGSRLAAS